MEETIKGIEVIAYKGMKSDMTCSGFHYEIGKTYKTDKVKLCECGFHTCLNPRDVRYYYPQDKGSRYFKVKLYGEITKCDSINTKVAATKITNFEEITDTFNEVIKTTEWWKNDNVLDLLYWSEGFARVQRKNGLMNFIDKDGKILSDEWFEWVDTFNEGFARVKRGDKLYNFINKKGKFLSNEWFIYAYSFVNGFAKVERKDYLDNFIDRRENILSNEWFNYVGKFNDGLADVKRTNSEWCQIDKTGTLIKLQ